MHVLRTNIRVLFVLLKIMKRRDPPPVFSILGWKLGVYTTTKPARRVAAMAPQCETTARQSVSCFYFIEPCVIRE